MIFLWKIYSIFMQISSIALVLQHGRLAHTLDIPTIVVLKSYDIFYDVHDSRKRVVGVIYAKQYVL